MGLKLKNDMMKLILYIVSVILIIGIGYVFCLSLFFNPPIKIESKKVLIEAIPIYENGDTLFWYRYDQLLHSQPMNFISVSKEFSSLTPDSAKIQSEDIKDLYVSNDSIIIISESDIEVFDSSLKIRVKKEF